MTLAHRKGLYDRIRQCYVADTPEERVRQSFLRRLIEELSFPQSLIAVEKSLDQLPHLRAFTGQLPQRRADVICFARGSAFGEALFPLLLVECKAFVALTQAHLDQVTGYNHFVGAPFVCVVNASEVRMAWQTGPGIQEFVDHIPPYSQLLASLGPSLE